VEEVIGAWRELNNEELHNLFFAEYYYDYRIKEDEMGEECNTSRKDEKCTHNFLRKSEENGW
jgi:hypothetical protein